MQTKGRCRSGVDKVDILILSRGLHNAQPRSATLTFASKLLGSRVLKLLRWKESSQVLAADCARVADTSLRKVKLEVFLVGFCSAIENNVLMLRDDLDENCVCLRLDEEFVRLTDGV